jgi:hypothetical protein
MLFELCKELFETISFSFAVPITTPNCSRYLPKSVSGSITFCDPKFCHNCLWILSTDPGRDPYKKKAISRIRIRIRIKVKILELWWRRVEPCRPTLEPSMEAHPGAVETCNGGLEAQNGALEGQWLQISSFYAVLRIRNRDPVPF